MEIVGPASCYYVSQRIRLHYVDWGNAKAPPLVLVHGGRDHARSWDWVARALRDRYHVVAPDLRGHGDSAWAIGSNYPHYEFVYDLAQLFDIVAPGDAPLTVIGHSFGGALLTTYAASYPKRFTKLVNVEGFGPPPELVGRWSGTAMHEQMRTWIEQLRALAARQPRRYASIDDAAARMKQENPSLSAEQAEHLTVHGVAPSAATRSKATFGLMSTTSPGRTECERPGTASKAARRKAWSASTEATPPITETPTAALSQPGKSGRAAAMASG
mgnify:CR=1 FL=1